MNRKSFELCYIYDSENTSLLDHPSNLFNRIRVALDANEGLTKNRQFSEAVEMDSCLNWSSSTHVCQRFSQLEPLCHIIDSLLADSLGSCLYNSRASLGQQRGSFFARPHPLSLEDSPMPCGSMDMDLVQGPVSSAHF